MKSKLTGLLLSAVLPIAVYAQAPNYTVDSLQTLLAQTEPTDTLKAYYNLMISAVYMGQDELDSAGVYGVKALEISQELKWETGIQQVPMLISGIYMFQSRYADAIAVQRKLTDSEYALSHRHFRSNAFNNLGLTYQQIGDHKRAIECFEKGIELAEGLNIKGEPAFQLSNLGLSLLATKELESALTAMRRARVVGSEANFIGLVEKIELNIANVHMELGNLDSARIYIDNILQNSDDERLGSVLQYGESLLAIWNQKSGNYSDAIANAESIIQRAQASGMSDYYIEMYDVIYKSYLNLDNEKEALHALEQYHFWKDSLEGNTAKLEIVRAELDAKSEMEKEVLSLRHQQEFELEQEKNTNRITLGASFFGLILLAGGFFWYRGNQERTREKEELIKKAKDEEHKALRAQMDPHFIKNSLVKINELIAEGKEDVAERYILKFSRLLEMNLQNSDNLYVSLDDELEALRAYLDLEQEKRNHFFTYEIKVLGDIDPEEVKVPSLLLQPFVENSIIHGFADRSRGHISIIVKEINNKIHIEIEDDGIGRKRSAELHRPEEKEKRIGGYGTKLSKARLEILSQLSKTEAKLNYTDLESGTRVEIDLPII